MGTIKTDFMTCKCKDLAQRGGLECLCTLRGKKTKIKANSVKIMGRK